MPAEVRSGVDTSRSTPSSLILEQRLLDVDGITLGGILSRDQRLRRISQRLRVLMRRAPRLVAAGQQVQWVSALASGMAKFMTEQFQYADFSLPELSELYGQFVHDMSAAWHDNLALHSSLCRHHDRLADWVAGRLEAVGALDLVRSTGFRPVCAQYSPEVQLQVLGLAVAELADPVLDLWCGDGHLVYFLRQLGFDAEGVDRVAPAGLLQGDWLDAPLPARHWGTIIAHQSVSLHFQSAHLHSNARAARYARLFMKILGAVRSGGCFVYAPSIPFLENLLPEEYAQVHSVAGKGFQATKLVRVSL